MMKMAAVFIIPTCTVSLRTLIFPRWMALLGFALAVLLISVYILMTNLQLRPDA